MTVQTYSPITSVIIDMDEARNMCVLLRYAAGYFREHDNMPADYRDLMTDLGERLSVKYGQIFDDMRRAQSSAD